SPANVLRHNCKRLPVGAYRTVSRLWAVRKGVLAGVRAGTAWMAVPSDVTEPPRPYLCGYGAAGTRLLGVPRAPTPLWSGHRGPMRSPDSQQLLSSGGQRGRERLSVLPTRAGVLQLIACALTPPAPQRSRAERAFGTILKVPEHRIRSAMRQEGT